MALDKQPTETGKRRNEPDGIYRGGMNDEKDWYPCVCLESCPMNCKGECGCEACYWCYQDFLSCE